MNDRAARQLHAQNRRLTRRLADMRVVLASTMRELSQTRRELRELRKLHASSSSDN